MQNYSCKIVAAVTGGGTGFISDALEAGGASSYFLEGVIPYSRESFVNFCGEPQGKFCSEKVARQLANASFEKGLSYGFKRDMVGVGATCSLASINEREGRENKVFVACLSNSEVASLEFVFDPKNKPSRKQQEIIAKNLISSFSENFCYYINCKNTLQPVEIENIFRSFNLLQGFGRCTVNVASSNLKNMHSDLLLGKNRNYFYHKIGTNNYILGKKEIYVYSGSFNPIHDGHRHVFNQAKNLFGKDNCYLELSICNASKPPLDPIELGQRFADMKNESDNIIFTNSAKFCEKFRTIQNRAPGAKVTFIVGGDTAARIEKMGRAEYSFLVIDRPGHETKWDHLDESIISEFSSQFSAYPEPISSTQIRNNNEKD